MVFRKQQVETIARWRAAKKYAADNAENIKAQFEAAMSIAGIQISVTNFCLVLQQMTAQKLKGVPYIDARTFDGWRFAGRYVRKGESATLHSITWVAGGRPAPEPGNNETPEEMTRLYPRATALFHISQTEPIEQKETAAA